MYQLSAERKKKSFYIPPTRKKLVCIAESEIEKRKKNLLPNVIGLQNHLSSKYIKPFPIKVCINEHVKEMLMRITLSTDDGVNSIPNSLLFLFLRYLCLFFISAVRKKHTDMQGFSKRPYLFNITVCLLERKVSPNLLLERKLFTVRKECKPKFLRLLRHRSLYTYLNAFLLERKLFLWPGPVVLQVLTFLNEFGRLSEKSPWAMSLPGFAWNQKVFPANCLLLILWWIVRSARKLTGKEDNASFLYFFINYLYIIWTGNLLTKSTCSAHKLKNITTSATTDLWNVKIF